MKRVQIIPIFFLITVLSLSTLYACRQSANQPAETNPSSTPTASSIPAPTLESIKEKIKSIDNRNVADDRQIFQELSREYTTYSKEQLSLDVSNKNYATIQYIDEKIVRLLNQDSASFKKIEEVSNDQKILEKNKKIDEILFTLNNNRDYLQKLLTALDQARKQDEGVTTPENNSSDIRLLVLTNTIIIILIIIGYGVNILYPEFSGLNPLQISGDPSKGGSTSVQDPNQDSNPQKLQPEISIVSKLYANQQSNITKIDKLLNFYTTLSEEIKQVRQLVSAINEMWTTKTPTLNSQHTYSNEIINQALHTLTNEIKKNSDLITQIESKQSTQNVPILSNDEISNLLSQQTSHFLEKIKNILVNTNTTASDSQESYKFELLATDIKNLTNQFAPLVTILAQIVSTFEDNKNNFYTSDQSTQDSPLANQSEALNDQRLNELRERIESLETEKKNLESEIQQLKEDKSGESLQIKQAQEEIKELQEEKISWQEQIDKKEQEIKEIKKEKDKLSLQIEKLKKEDKNDQKHSPPTAGNSKILINDPEFKTLVLEYNNATNIDVSLQNTTNKVEVGEEEGSYNRRRNDSSQPIIFKPLDKEENLYFIIKLQNSDNCLLFPKKRSISQADFSVICGPKSPFKYEGSQGGRFDIITPATVSLINPSKGEWQLKEQGKLQFKG